MTKQLQTILAREIRFYILPLPFRGYAVPGAIAQCCDGDLWDRWLDCWESSYIPLRAVCKVFRCLHLGELVYAIKVRWTTRVYPTTKPKVLPRLLSPGQLLFAQYINNYTLRQLRLETRELGLKTSKNKKEMARRIVATSDSTRECP